MNEEQIKQIIKEEISKHEAKVGEHHLDTIADAVYKQLLEYMTIEQMSKMIVELKDEFVNVIDDLTPVVDDYEKRIEGLLDNHLGKIVDKV